MDSSIGYLGVEKRIGFRRSVSTEVNRRGAWKMRVGTVKKLQVIRRQYFSELELRLSPIWSCFNQLWHMPDAGTKN